MSSGPVAVIDIGSNSIKILVAVRVDDGGLLTLHSRTLDARISAGISHQRPRLSPEGMARGREAIRTLLGDADTFAATRRVLVATSAVRDAENGGEFRAQVRAATGEEIRILTGEEEANLIGQGLTCDPALRQLRDFHVFDLGGGSLEALAFLHRHVGQAVSLPLGCVRLTERFVADPSQPFAPSAGLSIAAEVRAQFERAAFVFSRPSGTVAVGTGGSIATARTILGAREQKTFEATASVVPVDALRELLTTLGALPLAARREIRGLPPARADVFPTALATLIAVAEIGGFDAFHHSLFNLRYGLAAEALGGA